MNELSRQNAQFVELPCPAAYSKVLFSQERRHLLEDEFRRKQHKFFIFNLNDNLKQKPEIPLQTNLFSVHGSTTA